MISFLASPKAFSGIAGAQQKRALRSWLESVAGAEVFLYGNLDGCGEAASELGVGHVPDIAATDQGTPLFGAIAEHADRAARNEVLVYVNADILLGSDMAAAIPLLPPGGALGVGQRIDLSEGDEVRTTAGRMFDDVRELARSGRASLHDPGGSDYFMFRRGTWRGLGPVAIGRGGYDNALIAFCIRKGIPVFDLTLRVLAVHQFHDYSHVAGGIRTVFEGEEARRNLMETFGQEGLALPDADYVLAPAGVRRNRGRGDGLRHLETRLRLRWRIPALAETVRLASRIRGRIAKPRLWRPTLPEVLEEYSGWARDCEYGFGTGRAVKR